MEEEIKKRNNFGPILISPFLLNLCHGKSQHYLYLLVRSSDIVSYLLIIVFTELAHVVLLQTLGLFSSSVDIELKLRRSANAVLFLKTIIIIIQLSSS